MDVIDEIKNILIDLKDYNPKAAELASELFYNMESKGINMMNIRLLDFFCKDLLSSVPTDMYEIHIKLTDHINWLMAYWYANEEHEKTEEEFLMYHFFIMDNNYHNTNLLSMLGIMGLAWEYLMKSIFPPYSAKNKNFDFQQVYSVWEKGIKSNIPSREIIIGVCANYFYLSRILGHNFTECLNLYDKSNKWVKYGASSTEEDINYLCFFLSFLKFNNNPILASNLYEKLSIQYNIEVERNKLSALKICQALFCIATSIKKSETDWAEKGLQIIRTLRNYPIEMKIDFELSILLNNFEMNKVEIMKVLTGYLEYIQDNISVDSLRRLQKQKMSNFVNRCIVSAINKNDYRFALECAILWKEFPECQYKFINDEIILISLPNLREDKMVYIISNDKQFQLYEYEREVSLRDLLTSKNNFEGTWTVIIGDNSETPDFTGNPNDWNSEEYYEVLKKFYSIEEITNVLQIKCADKIVRVLEIPWMNTPLEQILSVHTEYLITTFTSTEFKVEAKVKKVLLWCDPDQTLFTAYQEKEALEENFRKFGDVEVDAYSGVDCTYELFKEKYADSKYDMIWIACHGMFNFDNPTNSMLYISKDRGINIEELQQLIPNKDTRRLLVLNSCQSGCASIRNESMNLTGFGSCLSNKSQSVVGHLWPIDSFAASIFGAMFSYYIAIGYSWNEAINRSRCNMALGNENLLQVFERDIKYDMGINIYERLINSSKDMKNLIYWASPMLFQ